MSAGLPGLGLGGLFLIVSALLAPLVELVRTLRGRSSAGAWREVGRNFTIAVCMVAVIDLSLRAFLAVSLLWGAGNAPRLDDATVVPLGPAAITFALLATVLAVAKLTGLGLAAHARRRAPVYLMRGDASRDRDRGGEGRRRRDRIGSEHL
ncbi:hypothetical protein HJD18_10505 [Thermoleophilia bacterium SCSIO 60948]|nr:hypothetical protein HJD18_10505 [Thermoleophilia bacterium SCSIO 60948]